MDNLMDPFASEGLKGQRVMDLVQCKGRPRFIVSPVREVTYYHCVSRCYVVSRWGWVAARHGGLVHYWDRHPRALPRAGPSETKSARVEEITAMLVRLIEYFSIFI